MQRPLTVVILVDAAELLSDCLPPEEAASTMGSLVVPITPLPAVARDGADAEDPSGGRPIANDWAWPPVAPGGSVPASKAACAACVAALAKRALRARCDRGSRVGALK
eukprot:CAMPEP_0117459654 /NCGR_PEP_ID=MMETSP0784-20121206/1593_1 /TAXON_ID=39447 /ORGANISM="" /LENGTH=107 /DNA_ID=CAMNT_0005253281 /DNA_START=257 /DNA_END=581 /DNA_ORIENTATION=-